jgi:DnaJ-class molecular chaperone
MKLKCPKCYGAGWLDSYRLKCHRCKGEGELEIREEDNQLLIQARKMKKLLERYGD